MKKTIGILSVALLSMVIFTNKSLNENDTTLKNIIAISQAQAEMAGSNTWTGFSVSECNVLRDCKTIWRMGPKCYETEAHEYSNPGECTS